MKNSKHNYFLQYIEQNTDNYFLKTQAIVKQQGDIEVVYALFLHFPALYAPLYVLEFLAQAKHHLDCNYQLFTPYKEGDFIPAGSPIAFIKGNFSQLCILETGLLQNVGYPMVAAYMAKSMALALPKVKFISMGARHYPNSATSNMVDYGVNIGTKQAKLQGAIGFVGSSTGLGSRYFGLQHGLGTMPHALVGYAGSTLRAAQMYYQSFSGEPLVVLVDYFGKEITESLQICFAFKELAKAGELYLRIDTNGKRYLEGLNKEKSKAIVQKWLNKKTSFALPKESQNEENYWIGKGVSVAAVIALKLALLKNGFDKVKIVVSSGFNLKKCEVMKKAKAPIDIIGTGSVLPPLLGDTFATADIIEYGGKPLVKVGREHLSKIWKDISS